MSFISFGFLLFLVVVFVCYFAVPRKARWCVLLAASFVFFWLSGGFFALSIISSTILSVYASGLWASALRKKEASRALRRAPLAICLTANLGALAFFRYSNVIFPSMGLLLITGVSFYTFQACGYLIDIYTGKAEAERNPLKFALFVSFFPQLIQGPISFHSEIAADLYAGHGWDWDRARSGIQRIIWGYFMKLIVADYAAVMISSVFNEYWKFGGAIIVFTLLIYSIQIYADFAGGINIALGVAEIIGIKPPENFNQPFFASSLADFWRRWHITLGRWFRSYMFYPLALSKALAKVGMFSRKIFGMRVGRMFQPCLATFCVFFAVGVWHGAGTDTLVFGMLNGTLISLSLFMEPFFEKLRVRTRIDGKKRGFGRVFAALRTLALIMFLRYFLRAASLSDALMMIKRTAYHPRLYELWDGTLLDLGLGLEEYIVMSAGVVILFLRDFITETGRKCSAIINNQKPAIQFVLLFGAFLALLIYGIFSSDAIQNDFIYAQF